jgi:hypothetical protein
MSFSPAAFTDKEMALIRADLISWPVAEQRLWVLMASTGAKLFELCETGYEESVDSYRIISLGKAGGMKRRIVIPECAQPFLPAVIDGPLFTLSCEYLEKRVRARLRKFGFGNDKNLSSLRLRAAATLKNDQKIPRVVIAAILGGGGLSVLTNPPSFAAISDAINVIGIGEM